MRIPYRVRRAFRRFSSPPALWLGKLLLAPALLRYGWDNDSFAADTAYLRLLMQYVKATHGPVLECGSGVSTILVSIMCKEAGRRHIALEHSAEWYKQIRSIMPTANLVYAPLKSYGEFDWYALPAGLPNGIGLVVCDGPPGTTRGGRFGALEVLQSYLAHPSILLMDDAERVEEGDILARWKKASGVEVEIVSSKMGAAAVVRIP